MLNLALTKPIARLDHYRGPGLDQGIEMLKSIKKQFGYKIITDIHKTRELIAEVADVIQIPLLCRQTDLIVSVAKTDKNIKKGQFMNPRTYETQRA